MNISAIRTRWAAVGAAVAISMGAGGIGIGHAVTDSGAKPIVKNIEPCRLASTRPAPDTVGSRTTGIGPDETYDLDGWGSVGNCNLPSDHTGLILNVTAVDATQQTNLRFFPQGGAVPTAANLNPSPGAPPTPNAVTVGLNPANGKFSVFNKFGVVAVVIDVVAYLDDHNHDDRYYTESEVDTALADKANSADVYTQAEVDTALADKANSADVYTKAEADALRYADLEITGQISSAGAKLGAGPFTSSRSSTGVYNLSVSGLAPFGIPYIGGVSNPLPIVSPTTSCAAGATAHIGWTSYSGSPSGNISSFNLRIETFDASGTSVDCATTFSVRFQQSDDIADLLDAATGAPAAAPTGRLEACTTTRDGTTCTG